MATLNLSKMKYMSETNLKKFASLIISLSSQVTDIENKCIKPYVGGELYPRDSYVSYNGYIYQATATNQDSVFNETHWDKLSDDFNELTVADIEGMLGLSSEQLETMANLILDTEVRIDKTYSSSKIYTDIQQCLNDSKAFTLEEIARASTASYKVVTSTSEMTNKSIIYLLPNGSTYDMYIVEENGATTKIGNMDVNLDNYFTKAEIEADYLKKADADGKYATINTVDGKVDKDKIVTTLDDTATDDQVASAKVIQEELDKKIDKDNLVTVLDNTVTDEQVASAKAVYDELQEVFQSVSNGKNLIASAITDKGVETLANATFETMADNIGKISGGGGFETIPTVFIMGTLASNNAKTINIDFSKNYIVTLGLTISSKVSDDKISHFSIINGVINDIIKSPSSSIQYALKEDGLKITNSKSGSNILIYSVLEM